VKALFDSIEKKDKNKDKMVASLAVLFNEIVESPEKLTTENALNIYNHYPARRSQIYAIFFSKIKKMEDWLEIYQVSKDNDESKVLAKKKLRQSSSSSKNWIEIYQTHKSDFIKNLSVVKIKENSKNLDDWIEVYKSCSYGFELKNIALFKMRENSKTFEDWLKVYKITPFGSNTKSMALEKILMKAKPKEESSQQTPKFTINQKTHKEWLEEYENTKDIYSPNKDRALVNSFLSLE